MDYPWIIHGLSMDYPWIFQTHKSLKKPRVPLPWTCAQNGEKRLDCKKKKAILSKNDDFGRLSSVPENICFWGSFFKIHFRRRPFNQKPLVFRKKSKDPSGGPRIIWWWRDFPRMSKIMNSKETHYPVGQKIGDAGSISTQNIFPLSSVTPKQPESPYGAKYVCWATNHFFQLFSFLAL